METGFFSSSSSPEAYAGRRYLFPCCAVRLYQPDRRDSNIVFQNIIQFLSLPGYRNLKITDLDQPFRRVFLMHPVTVKGKSAPPVSELFCGSVSVFICRDLYRIPCRLRCQFKYDPFKRRPLAGCIIPVFTGTLRSQDLLLSPFQEPLLSGRYSPFPQFRPM